MKPVTLNPGSFLLGVAFAGILAILVGATQSSGTVRQIPIREVRLVGEIPAGWWTYVELRTDSNGTPTDTYTVPANRYFVVTLCSLSNTSLPVFADGQNVNARLAYMNNNGTRVPLPPGALLTAGSINGRAQLWGYLEPAR